MTRKAFIGLLLVILPFAGCESCEEKLSKVCPPPQDCAVDSDGFVRVGKSELKFYPVMGECSLGRTTCDEDLNIICEGYTQPILEECNDKDDDCDGLIDNDLSWDADEDGVNSLSSCLNPGDCDDTNPEIYPDHTEICDGIDNNCDGKIDDIDAVDCWTGSDDVIFSATTQCKMGIMECIHGAMTNCQGQILDEPESCDGYDNDCDGLIDEDPVELQTLHQRVCGYNDRGLCSYGMNYCVGGDIKCFDAVMPENEVCNDLDDNCNGIVDENIYQPCETICGVGVEMCQGGSWVNCNAPEPQVELCDYIDNDCDGVVDEGCLCVMDDTQVCRENIYDSDGNLLNCGYGIQVCDMFGVWGPCIYQGIEPEICDNWDNDCDGTIDMIVAMCGNNPSLHGVGECMLGTTTCEVGEWGECVGEIEPTEEICDMLDNDCDGEIDEDLNAHDKVDMLFIIDISGSMCPYIQALYEGITAYVADFQDSEHRFGLVVHPMRHQYAMPELLTPTMMIDAASFQALLGGLECNGGGAEPTTDVVLATVDPVNPIGIPWRSDAFPYVISISDEGPQSMGGNYNTPSDIAPLASICQIAGCEPGDSVEIFFIDAANYLSSWGPACGNDPDRLISIDPASGARYTQILQGIFEDVCF